MSEQEPVEMVTAPLVNTYFSDPVITRKHVVEFLTAATALLETSPWSLAERDELVHVAIDALGLPEGTLSILGASGSARGFMLYPTIDDYHQMLDDHAAGAETEARFSGTALTFRNAEDTPERLRDEAHEAGWASAAHAVFPVPGRLSAGVPAAITLDDLRRVTATARALARLTEARGEALYKYGEHALEESYIDEHGLTTTLTVPHPEVDLEDLEAPPRAQTYPGVDNPYTLPLSARELQKLEAALPGLSLHRLIGLFSATASTPTRVAPSAWMPMISSELKLKAVADRDGVIELLQRVHGNVMERMEADDIEGLVPAEDAELPCREWSRGYAEIWDTIELADEADDELMQRLFALHLLAGDRETTKAFEAQGKALQDQLAELRGELVDHVAFLHERSAQARALEDERILARAKPIVRAEPKTGRNDPCPCGSGKKYKKCHG